MFRDAESTDFSDIQRLYGQLHPDDPPLTDGSDRAAFDQILGSPWLQLYVLEQEGSIVATTYLNIIPNLTRGASPYAVVENVVVDQDLRGRGVGKEIMAATLRQAWDAGCYKAMLMTGSRQAATLGFYRACGFSADDKTGFIARPETTRRQRG